MATPDNKGKTYKTHKLNPRAAMFKQFYIDPSSHTFWNIRGSAIRAGYSEEYAENISNTKPKWWIELQESAEFNRAEMLSLAENNIKKTLKDVPDTDTKVKQQHDASKFVAERVGKDHYSTRKELTDKGGRKLFTNQSKDTSDTALEEMFIGVAPIEQDT